MWFCYLRWVVGEVVGVVFVSEGPPEKVAPIDFSCMQVATQQVTIGS